MRRMLILGVLLAFGAVGAQGQASGADEWDKLVAANDLNAEGRKPFHLEMTFQLYDLSGKPAETGSLETWWSAPGQERTVVHLAGLNEDGTEPEGADEALVRDAALVRQLTELEIEPLPKLGPAVEFRTKPTKFGKTELDCMSPMLNFAQLGHVPLTLTCVAPKTTQALLLESIDGKRSLIRQKMGTFQKTHVALETRIGFLGKDAIVGTVTRLQTVEPSQIQGEAPGTSPARQETHLFGGLDGERRISFEVPDYPEIGKMEHRSGSVILNVLIGVDGQVRKLVPIASTNPIFTPSAIKAVKHWRYTPYVLNGAPAEVETIVTVNFALNGG